jgi:hypothetical protein
MKGIAIAAVLLVSVTLAMTPTVSTIYREAFPTEPTKRAALAACAQADPGFRRLIAEQRAQCYARQLQTPPPPDPVPRRDDIATSGAPKPLAF